MYDKVVDLDILWIVSANGPLLNKVAEFLTNADQAVLSGNLQKLEQDVGVRIADHMNDLPSSKRPPSTELAGLHSFIPQFDPDNFHDTPVLMDNYEMITYERFKVLDEVETALVQMCAPMVADYEAMMRSYRQVLGAVFSKDINSQPQIPATSRAPESL